MYAEVSRADGTKLSTSDMDGGGEGACDISAYGRASIIPGPKEMLVGGVGATGGFGTGTAR